MEKRMSAGQMRERVELLELREQDGVWTWEVCAQFSTRAVLGVEKNLFSSVGIGARGVTLGIRCRALTLHNALRWKGQHLFLTAILEHGPGWLEVSATVVEVVACVGDVDTGHPGPHFPGVLTEKYLRHEQLVPMAQNTICFVLVTPKPIVLAPGSLVEVGGAPYEVQLCHVLDPYKNEYEIVRMGEP